MFSWAASRGEEERGEGERERRLRAEMDEETSERKKKTISEITVLSTHTLAFAPRFFYP